MYQTITGANTSLLFQGGWVLNVHLTEACTPHLFLQNNEMAVKIQLNKTGFNSVSPVVRCRPAVQHQTASLIYFPLLSFSVISIFLHFFHTQAKVGNYSSFFCSNEDGQRIFQHWPSQLVSKESLPQAPSSTAPGVPMATSQQLPCPSSCPHYPATKWLQPCSSTRTNLSALLLLAFVAAKCNNVNNFSHFYYLGPKDLKWNILKLNFCLFVS